MDEGRASEKLNALSVPVHRVCQILNDIRAGGGYCTVDRSGKVFCSLTVRGRT